VLELVARANANPGSQIAGSKLARQDRQALQGYETLSDQIETKRRNQNDDQQQRRQKYAAKIRTGSQCVILRLAGNDVDGRMTETVLDEQLPCPGKMLFLTDYRSDRSPIRRIAVFGKFRKDRCVHLRRAMQCSSAC
jgi:hypothetical protein